MYYNKIIEKPWKMNGYTTCAEKQMYNNKIIEKPWEMNGYTTCAESFVTNRLMTFLFL